MSGQRDDLHGRGTIPVAEGQSPWQRANLQGRGTIPATNLPRVRMRDKMDKEFCDKEPL